MAPLRAYAEEQVQQWKELRQSNAPISRSGHQIVQSSGLCRPGVKLALFGGTCGGSASGFSAGLHLGQLDPSASRIAWTFVRPRIQHDSEVAGSIVAADSLIAGRRPDASLSRSPTESWPCARTGHTMVRLVLAERGNYPESPLPGSPPAALRQPSAGSASSQASSERGGPSTRRSASGLQAEPLECPRIAVLMGGETRIPSISGIWARWRAAAAFVVRSVEAAAAGGLALEAGILSSAFQPAAEATAGLGDGFTGARGLPGGILTSEGGSPLPESSALHAPLAASGLPPGLAADEDEHTDAIRALEAAGWKMELGLPAVCAQVASTIAAALLGPVATRHWRRRGETGGNAAAWANSASAWIHLVVAVGLRSTPAAMGWLYARCLAWQARSDGELQEAQCILQLFGEGATRGDGTGQEQAAALLHVLQSGIPPWDGACRGDPVGDTATATGTGTRSRGLPVSVPAPVLLWQARRLQRCMDGLLGASRGGVWPLGQVWALDLEAVEARCTSSAPREAGSSSGAGAAAGGTGPAVSERSHASGLAAMAAGGDHLPSIPVGPSLWTPVAVSQGALSTVGPSERGGSTPPEIAPASSGLPMPFPTSRHTAAASPALSWAIAQHISTRRFLGGAWGLDGWRWAAAVVSFGGFSLARGVSAVNGTESLLELGVSSSAVHVILARERDRDLRASSLSAPIAAAGDSSAGPELAPLAGPNRLEFRCFCVPLRFDVPRSPSASGGRSTAEEASAGPRISSNVPPLLEPQDQDGAFHPGSRMDHRLVPMGAAARLAGFPGVATAARIAEGCTPPPTTDRFLSYGGYSQANGLCWGGVAPQALVRSTDTDGIASPVLAGAGATPGIGSFPPVAAGDSAATTGSGSSLDGWERPVQRGDVWELCVKAEAQGATAREGAAKALIPDGEPGETDGVWDESGAGGAMKLAKSAPSDLLSGLAFRGRWRLVVQDAKTAPDQLSCGSLSAWSVVGATSKSCAGHCPGGGGHDPNLRMPTGLPRLRPVSSRGAPCARSLALAWSQGEQLLVYGGSIGYSLGDQFRLDSATQLPECRVVSVDESGQGEERGKRPTDQSCTAAAVGLARGGGGGAGVASGAGGSKMEPPEGIASEPGAPVGKGCVPPEGSCAPQWETLWQPRWRLLRAWSASGHRRVGMREGASVVVLKRCSAAGKSAVEAGDVAVGGSERAPAVSHDSTERIAGVLLWGGASRQVGSSFATPKNDSFLLEAHPRWVRPPVDQ